MFLRKKHQKHCVLLSYGDMVREGLLKQVPPLKKYRSTSAAVCIHFWIHGNWSAASHPKKVKNTVFFCCFWARVFKTIVFYSDMALIPSSLVMQDRGPRDPGQDGHIIILGPSSGRGSPEEAWQLKSLSLSKRPRPKKWLHVRSGLHSFFQSDFLLTPLLESSLLGGRKRKRPESAPGAD